MSGRLLAYVGLGANVGDARRSLERAVAALAALPGARLVAVSRLYRTRPVGLTEQPDFLNAVVALDVPRGETPEEGAMALLVALKQLERALGRRERERWGPREIDLDLLTFGDHRVRVGRVAGGEVPLGGEDEAGGGADWLVVPHPRASERLFVLAPLAELSPRLVPPGWRRSVAEAETEARRREPADAAVVEGDWDAAAGIWLSGPDASGGSGAVP